MFEHHKQPLLTRRAFVVRLARSLLMACAVILVAGTGGTLGYHYLGGLAWIDAVLNAAMILSGMGQVGEVHTTAAKLFASFYALVSGFVFLTVAAVLLGPLVHRMMHRFHVEVAEDPSGDRKDEDEERAERGPRTKRRRGWA